MSYHIPSRGNHGIQNGFLGKEWISIPKYYEWKSIPFQTDLVITVNPQDFCIPKKVGKKEFTSIKIYVYYELNGLNDILIFSHLTLGFAKIANMLEFTV
jgi:hypothetical protein